MVALIGVLAVCALAASAWLAWRPCANAGCAPAEHAAALRAHDEPTAPAVAADAASSPNEPVARPSSPDAAVSGIVASAVVPENPDASAVPPANAPTATATDAAPEPPASDAAIPDVAPPPVEAPPPPVSTSPPSAPTERDDAPAAAAPGAQADVSGTWLLNNEVQSTSYAPYRGLRLAYRARLVQDGSKIVGSGVKWAENGRTLPDSQRTPISFEGHVEGNTVSLRFNEQGKRRTSRGVLTWDLAPGGDEMRGTFSSTAASSSGVSSAHRLPG